MPAPPDPTAAKPVVAHIPMVNEMRLSPRQWLIALALVLLALLLTPPLWKTVERFDTGPDYRIPYDLSKDYWLYQRWIGDRVDPKSVVMLGDSVVWGEYVLPDGTWTHFLNAQSGRENAFANGGVNGLFPLALEGLEKNYGKALRHRRILLHCNLLWLSSPKADLSSDKEERFNHAQLVPQFSPRIPCYKASANDRLGAVIERQVGFCRWVNHLQSAYFGQKSILNWTLEDDGGDPPQYTNSARNPLAQITLRVPTAPPNDPLRGPASPRHKPWTQNGGPTPFEWVALDHSLQWAAFQRVVAMLHDRGDDVFVILGPFNEHMIAADSRPGYNQLKEGVTRWLADHQIRHWIPDPLPTELYADASHPLTAGYELLAKETLTNTTFQTWLGKD